jgi:hypothetical protein
MTIGEISELSSSIIEEPLHDFVGALQLLTEQSRLTDTFNEAMVFDFVAMVLVRHPAYTIFLFTYKRMCSTPLGYTCKEGLITLAEKLRCRLNRRHRGVGWFHLRLLPSV